MKATDLDVDGFKFKCKYQIQVQTMMLTPYAWRYVLNLYLNLKPSTSKSVAFIYPLYIIQITPP